MFLDIWKAAGEGEADIKAMKECLKAAQDALPNSLFESLIKSMSSRIVACVEANGVAHEILEEENH